MFGRLSVICSLVMVGGLWVGCQDSTPDSSNSQSQAIKGKGKAGTPASTTPKGSVATGGACTIDDDCVAKNDCVNAVCTAEASGSGEGNEPAEVEGNADGGAKAVCTPACAAGQECEDGVCVTDTEATCATPCAAGQECKNGTCVADSKDTCATPCATGEVCKDGACVSKP